MGEKEICSVAEKRKTGRSIEGKNPFFYEKGPTLQMGKRKKSLQTSGIKREKRENS